MSAAVAVAAMFGSYFGLSPTVSAAGATVFLSASPPPIDDTIPDEQGNGASVIDNSQDLINPATQTTLPPGCLAPPVATATFLGELVSTDDLLATYRVVQERGGSLGAHVSSGLISIRYADRETRFLQAGEIYLVGAGASELFTTLESKVRAERGLFGGDAVVGIDETDVPCPRIEDPVITLKPNGEFVDSGVLSLLGKQPDRLVLAFLLPSFLVFVLLIGLVILKRLMQSARRSIRRR